MGKQLARKWCVRENMERARAGVAGAGVSAPEIDALESELGMNRTIGLAFSAQNKEAPLFIDILIRDRRLRGLGAVRKLALWAVRP